VRDRLGLVPAERRVAEDLLEKRERLVVQCRTYNDRVNTIRRRAAAAIRVFRSEKPPAEAWQLHGSTPEARMSAVWELTLQCLAWQGDLQAEPRLQRSVVRIQRPRR
jgi:hypothetical protein